MLIALRRSLISFITNSQYRLQGLDSQRSATRSSRSLHRRWQGIRQQPVPVSIRDALNSPRDRQWIQAQYPEYLEDLSQTSMNTGVFPASGEIQAELMARWFADDSSYPLIILSNEQPVGFALVSRPPRNRRDQVDFRMAEFYVAPRSRRLGIGRSAAELIFNRFAGHWEVTEFAYNKSAVSFWRSILSEYTGGRFQERVVQDEVHQMFTSGNRQRAR